MFLERFRKVPKPLTDITSAFGVHPVVCCPEKIPHGTICFPDQAWCPYYQPPIFEDEEYDGNYDNYD